MTDLKIDNEALILVGDGSKALFLRNKGDARHLNLVVERVLEQENPPTREQGTDRPGRYSDGVGPHNSAFEETDWHRLAEERFATDIAASLYKAAHASRFDKLVVVAPPQALGDLRKAFHKEVQDRIVGEINKNLTSHPVNEIEKLLAA